MTDSKLRKLERASASGDVEAEAKLLLERVRAGDLPEEKLRLAAYLGHEPARVALGATWLEDLDYLSSLKGQPGISDLSIWVYGLENWDDSVCVRAQIALALLLLPGWEEDHPKDNRLRTAVEYSERWVAAPNEWRAKDSGLIAGKLISADLRVNLVNGDPAGYACWGAAWAAWRAGAQPLTDVLGQAAGLAEKHLGDPGSVWSAILAELVPWALGLGDPVRDRVEAREREGGA